MADIVFKIMLSSTYRDLIDPREAVRDAILGQGMLPLMMETDSANPSRGIIASSLAKVDEADAYVALISNYRYGQVIKDTDLNPEDLSVTELEFRRAEERDLPLCIFLMDEDVPVSPREMRQEAIWADKLEAFRNRAQHPGRIIASFTNVEQLKGKVIQTLAGLRSELEGQRSAKQAAIAARSEKPNRPLKALTFFAKPPYTPGHMFQGRVHELATLDAWVRSADPVMVVEAIGGMGKSMVTWEWLTKHTPDLPTRWVGRLWYSFYERGADMRDFKVTALAYMTGQAPERFLALPEADLTAALLDRLREGPWLLALDGLERILAAYHRSDAAQVEDNQIGDDTGLTGQQPHDCIRGEDERLLRGFPAAGSSKILISSRLMPKALLNVSGEPVPGVKRIALHGLAPEDAEVMMRRAGVNGNSARIRNYLIESFEGHPLVVGFVVGLIRKSPWARMDFDIWVDDQRGGAAVNLADPDVKQRRTHILELAFSALPPPERELMDRIGMLASAIDLEVLEALNPTRPDPPHDPWVFEDRDPDKNAYINTLQVRLREIRDRKGREGDLLRQIDEARQDLAKRVSAYEAELTAWRETDAVRRAPRWLNEALIDLEVRGLLQWDHQAGTFDLHPVVRSYAVASLTPAARGEAGQRVADYFSSRSASGFYSAATLQDLADGIQVVRALNLAGKTQQAWMALSVSFRTALARLERHHEMLALLRPLFPDGWASPPKGVYDTALVANEAAAALYHIGRTTEAAVQEIFSINGGMSYRFHTGLSARIRNHFMMVTQRNEIARSDRILRLAHEVALFSGGFEDPLWSDVLWVQSLIDRGDLINAQRVLENINVRPEWAARGKRLEAEEICVSAWLQLRKRTLSNKEITRAISQIQQLGQRTFERRIWFISGEWNLQSGADLEAKDAFDHAIRMAREVGLVDSVSEARRGLALARLGHFADAEDAAASAERDPPHVALAELYLKLNQLERACQYAVSGYKWAWADGPPFCRHWDLAICRALLQSLNIPEPHLSPFDPTKVEPIPYEVEIRRLLKDHAGDQRR